MLACAGGHPDPLREAGAACFRLALERRLSAEIRLRLAEKAIQAEAAAVSAAPSDYLPWLWLARAEAQLGQWDEAELCVDRARALKPHDRNELAFP